MIVESLLSGRIYFDVYLQDDVYYSRIDDGLDLDKNLGKVINTENRKAKVGDSVLVIKDSNSVVLHCFYRGQKGTVFEVNEYVAILKLDNELGLYILYHNEYEVIVNEEHSQSRTL